MWRLPPLGRFARATSAQDVGWRVAGAGVPPPACSTAAGAQAERGCCSATAIVNRYKEVGGEGSSVWVSNSTIRLRNVPMRFATVGEPNRLGRLVATSTHRLRPRWALGRALSVIMVDSSHDCVVVAVAEHSAEVLASATLLASQLHTALTRRAVIDQATGIMAARTGRGTDDALAQLRALTQVQNITLAEASQRIVDEAIAAAES